jgi:adenylate cyclase
MAHSLRVGDCPPTCPWVASGTSSSCSGLGPSLPHLWEATKHPAYVGEMEAPPLERKLVAILAADVAGYSRMMGIDEEGTLATLSDLRTITDALIAQHSGRICGTAGDSVLAAFASVFAAVQCAVEIQRDVARANEQLADERRMWFRIGVNVGDVMVKDGDIFGDGVNIAARIEGLAEPGGICISRGVHDHVMRKLSYRFEDLGEKSVKNIAQPIRVFRLICEGGPAALDAQETPDTAIVAGGAGADVPSLLEPLPVSPQVDPQSVELVFWESIKDSTRVSDYQAYLGQYPDGIFVALARTRLDEYMLNEGVVRTSHEDEVELLFWESVRNSDNPSSLRAYLEKYPDGDFRVLAEIRLNELGTSL